jgi:hypothetical protein
MRRFAYAIAVVAGALLLPAALPASAQPPDESFFTVDPAESVPGGTVSVTGVCPVDDVNNWEAVFFYLDIPGAIEGSEDTFFTLEHFTITPGETWTFTVTIPADAEPGPTTIAKQCARLDDEGNFDGGEATQRQDFTVLAVPTTSVTSTTSEVTTTEPAVAPAAAARPRFTG